MKKAAEGLVTRSYPYIRRLPVQETPPLPLEAVA